MHKATELMYGDGQETYRYKTTIVRCGDCGLALRNLPPDNSFVHTVNLSACVTQLKMSEC